MGKPQGQSFGLSVTGPRGGSRPQRASPQPSAAPRGLGGEKPKTVQFQADWSEEAGRGQQWAGELPSAGSFRCAPGQALGGEGGVGWGHCPQCQILTVVCRGVPPDTQVPSQPTLSPRSQGQDYKRLLNLTDWVGIQLATSQLGDLDKLLALVSSR